MTPNKGRSQEIAWRKTSFCQGGECAEVSQSDGEILLRSTRSPDDVIRLTAAEWSTFVAGIGAGDFSDFG
jgi:hypothetical protein